MKRRRTWVVGALFCYFFMALLFVVTQGFIRLGYTVAQDVQIHKATHSSPIALSANDALVWSVNTDDDSVSVIRTDTNELITNIKVEDGPESIALDPKNQYTYVANTAGNSVTAIKITDANPDSFVAAVDTSVGLNGSWKTGAEPSRIVISPNGKRVFVANSNQSTVTVINAENRTIIGSVNLRESLCNEGDQNRVFPPGGLAVTQDNQYLYVTRFLSFTKPGGVQADNDGKEGVVCRLNINTDSTDIRDYTPAAVIHLASRDTGFPDAANSEVAFPNQLQSIMIHDGRAYLPNIAAAPGRPLRFDTDTQAFVNWIDGIGGSETDGGALNLNLGARDPEPGKKKLFFSNQWAIAFTNQSGPGTAYSLSAGSDLLVKLNVDATGKLDFTVDSNTTRYIDLNDPTNPGTSGPNAGKNPLGIVITDDGKTAYTSNYLSRNVSVVDLTNDAVKKVIQTTALPTPGSHEEVVQVGAEMFFSSRGNFVRQPGMTISTSDRLSQQGFQNCASCHFKGWSDGVVWSFKHGPRRTLGGNGTFNPHDKNDQKIINYSAVRDEMQDFDLNARNVSGPNVLSTPIPCSAPPSRESDLNKSVFDPNHGLLVGDVDFNLPPCQINDFLAPANAGRAQLKVILPGSNVEVPALDAMNEWVKFGIRTPNQPLTAAELIAGGGNPVGGLNAADIVSGRKLFAQANCQACHGGGKWTTSKLNFTPPATESQIATEAGDSDANQEEFLYEYLRDIKSYNLNVAGKGNTIPGQPEIGGIEVDAGGKKSLGIDHNGDGKGNGFNVPSLLGMKFLPPYYHNGACETLNCVVADVNHRTAGLKPGQGDPLASPEAQKKLATFLEAIDAKTVPFKTKS